MLEMQKSDRRRESGERTRQRLLDAARALIAERGEDAVTLRDITQAAEANVAAVSYHFGSKDALCRAAIEQAVRRVTDEQVAGLRKLGDDAALEDIAEAWAGPVLGSACAAPCPEQAHLRIVARIVNDPPPELQEMVTDELARVDGELLARLRRALPDVEDDELRFRVECAAGVLHFASSGNMRVDLRAKTEEEFERLIIPVVAGTFAGGSLPGL